MDLSKREENYTLGGQAQIFPVSVRRRKRSMGMLTQAKCFIYELIHYIIQNPLHSYLQTLHHILLHLLYSLVFLVSIILLMYLS